MLHTIYNALIQISLGDVIYPYPTHRIVSWQHGHTHVHVRHKSQYKTYFNLEKHWLDNAPENFMLIQ